MNTTNETDKKTPMKQFKAIAPTTVATTSASLPPLQKNVPPFLNKLYSMVNDPESDDLICWSSDGASFFVNRQEDFARKVLPRFFKHKKFSSFVRQLNMYGFHKVPHLQQGVLETDSESERWEFSNPHFKRNQRDLLLLVNRKKGTNTDEKEISTVDLHHILEEIQSIKKHQMNISSQLQNIQKDNQVLWQETIAARERHHRHQETIDKILRFLASVFSNGEKRTAIPRKRTFLLGPAAEEESDSDGAYITEERPAKASRKDEFNIDDYVDGKEDLLDLNAALPEHLKESTMELPSADLEEAIALNDQSKNDPKSTLSSINGQSNISNIPQLQNLQALITLAQSNPELFNQLTNETFYGSNQPTQSTITLPPPEPINLTALANQQPRSLDQVTNSINNIHNTADALNQDINDLGISLQTLAQHLGFQSTDDDVKIEEDDGELLDMDEFLNTYGNDVGPEMVDPPAATITDIPSSTTTRSPSPVITTPGSIASLNKK